MVRARSCGFIVLREIIITKSELVRNKYERDLISRLMKNRMLVENFTPKVICPRFSASMHGLKMGPEKLQQSSELVLGENFTRRNSLPAILFVPRKDCSK